MATTGATGNQGSTGDQDPEPQQEILATAAGIRALGDGQGRGCRPAWATNTRVTRPTRPRTPPPMPWSARPQGPPEADRRSGSGRIV